MGRATMAADRLAALVLGIVLVVLGAAAVLWWTGTLASLWAGTPQTLRTGAVVDATRWDWMPWAAAALGLVLVVLALRWLVSHLPRRGIGLLLLPGSGADGRLTVDPDAAAAAAAEELAEAAGVRSAHARSLRDRGQLVVELAATVEPTADFAEVAAAADAAAGRLRTVVDRDDVRARVRLSVARRAGHRPRVS